MNKTSSVKESINSRPVANQQMAPCSRKIHSSDCTPPPTPFSDKNTQSSTMKLARKLPAEKNKNCSEIRLKSGSILGTMSMWPRLLRYKLPKGNSLFSWKSSRAKI
jgi:hypothetical protein